jgi:lantibiotic modifying enzyme
MGESLYDGRCGVALFLAALEAITGGGEYRHLALAALNPVCSLLREADDEAAGALVRQIGIGGAFGLGSILYAAVRAGRLLQAPEIVANLGRAANLIRPEQDSLDHGLDVMGGAAGAILGLLALYNETGEPAILDRAITCGTHLLQRMADSGEPDGSQALPASQPRVGFAHGGEGIAYGLIRLYAITGNRTYLEGARRHLKPERPDPGPTDRPGLLLGEQGAIGWCGGAAGVVLAHLGGLPFVADTTGGKLTVDAETALQSAQAALPLELDHLCCGAMGLIDALLVAARLLSRSSLRTKAHELAAYTVMRARQEQGYRLPAGLSQKVHSPGFFQGLAGIGYTLLRLAEPDRLPSALLWL